LSDAHVIVNNLLHSDLPPLSAVLSLRHDLAAAAQTVYDRWEQDANGEDVELGSGGICQDIAEEQAGVLQAHGIDAGTVSAQVGDQHVWVMAKVREGVYEVDIPPSVYEIGAGYNWKKRPGVVFSADDVLIGQISKNPNDFEAMTGE
jgi:hypothetical protein